MEIRTTEKYCILMPLSPILDKRESNRLFEEIKFYSKHKIGIDLSFVNNCGIEFLETIKNFKNISIFNIPSDIFVLFNVMNIDKYINLFVSETDFIDNKHRLLNRKFNLIKK